MRGEIPRRGCGFWRHSKRILREFSTAMASGLGCRRKVSLGKSTRPLTAELSLMPVLLQARASAATEGQLGILSKTVALRQDICSDLLQQSRTTREREELRVFRSARILIGDRIASWLKRFVIA